MTHIFATLAAGTSFCSGLHGITISPTSANLRTRSSLFAGVLLPLLSRRVKCMRPGSFIFTVGRCFGGGVVLATGMIHVFPGGIELLANPCLGWPDYPVRLLHASSHGAPLQPHQHYHHQAFHISDHHFRRATGSSVHMTMLCSGAP